MSYKAVLLDVNEYPCANQPGQGLFKQVCTAAAHSLIEQGFITAGELPCLIKAAEKMIKGIR